MFHLFCFSYQEPPPPKKPQDSVVQHQEPLDEDPTPGAFQGDMMLTDDQLRQIEMAIDDQKAGRKKRKAAINENARWTSNIVPYEISPSSSKSWKHLILNLAFNKTTVRE